MITLTEQMKKDGWLINHNGIERNNNDGGQSVIITRWDSKAREYMYSLWHCKINDDREHVGIYEDVESACQAGLLL